MTKKKILELLKYHLNSLQKKYPECKIIDLYLDPHLYDIKRLPKKEIIEYYNRIGLNIDEYIVRSRLEKLAKTWTQDELEKEVDL